MTAVIIRIALRWLAGALVAKGFLTDTQTDLFLDPDLMSMIEVGAGLLIGALVEGWYYFAKRFGWST